MSSSEGTLGRSSTLPATRETRRVGPEQLASRARALRCSLCACASSTRTPASATRALVSSTGETPACCHTFGNGIGSAFCQIDTGLSQCCTFLCRQSLEEGSDHGGTNFDAA